MRLDPDVFATELDALCERFGRAEPTDRLISRYYQHLQHLDTDAFRAAAGIIYRDDTYWPPPARFLDLAGASAKAEAEVAWEAIMTEVRAGRSPALTGTAKRALTDVGGYRAVAYCDEVRELPHRKRQFVAAFERFSSTPDRPALQAPTLFTLDK